ncbi:hypothetical protein Tco_1237593 [Tanacetum coccineum]
MENLVEGENESDADEFAYMILLSDEDFSDRIEPENHKDKPKEIDDDDDKKKDDNDEKHDDAKEDDYDNDDDDHNDHSLIRTQRTGNKAITEELTVSDTPMPDALTQDRPKPFSRRCTYIPGNGILEKVNESLKEIVPKIATSATNDLIQDNIPKPVTGVVKKERESSQPTNTVLNVHPTTSTSTATTYDLQQQLYLKMKSDLQSQLADPELWNALKAKYEKSYASNESCRNDAFRKHDHDEHQGDYAPPEEEKGAKRQKTLQSSKSARGSSSKQSAKETNTLASEQQ